MPFTPFHLGPALLIGLLTYKYLDFPTFIIANVIVDIRAILVFFGIVNGNLHGILHTFVGGTILAFGLIGGITPFRDNIAQIMDYFRMYQNHNDGTIVAAAFTGIYLHIVLDSFLYTDIQPFYPLDINSLHGLFSTTEVYASCIFLGIVGMALLPWRIDSIKFPH